jgi:hypothetical protein
LEQLTLIDSANKARIAAQPVPVLFSDIVLDSIDSYELLKNKFARSDRNSCLTADIPNQPQFSKLFACKSLPRYDNGPLRLGDRPCFKSMLQCSVTIVPLKTEGPYRYA